MNSSFIEYPRCVYLQIIVAVSRRRVSLLVIELEHGHHLLKMTVIIFGQHFFLILSMHDRDVIQQRRKVTFQRRDVTMEKSENQITVNLICILQYAMQNLAG